MVENIKYFEKGNTMNEFRYFNLDNPNACYDYYQAFANSLTEEMQPKNNQFNLKSIKQLSYNYSWDDSVNAGSYELEDLDMIKVNEGTILKLYNLFYKLNTRKKVIELSFETKPCTEIRSKIIYESNKNDEKPIESEMVFSDDVIRNNIAEYMAMFAIKWIIAHELGHAFNGHTRYYLEIRNKIKNENNDEKKENFFLDLQSMEMDADAFAVNRIIDVVMEIYKNNDKILKMLKNEIELLKLVVFSIHGVFYIFRECGLYGCTKREHPPTFIRECLALSSMKEYLIKNCNIKVDDNYISQDIGKIEKLLCEVDGKNNENYIDFIKNSCPSIEEHAAKIMSNFKNNIIYKIKDEARLPIEGIDY